MALTITRISDTFSTSPQITAEDVAEIAALGFKTIINNRPDGEGGEAQPTSESIKAAAQKAGLQYIHIPVIPGNITPANIAECASYLAGASLPALGFCRTGNRASSLYNQAMKQVNQAEQPTTGKQNWLMGKICDFFKNKCLITKLVRKLSK